MILAGKRAVVTGAGRGIGRGIAEAFADQGCDLALTARSDSELNKIAQAIRTKGRQAHVFNCDVSDERSTRAMIRDAAEALGGIDILVNNAGFAKFKSFTKLTTDDWRQTLDVNLMGVVWCCQEAIPFLEASSPGRIINIGSVASLKPIAKQSAYVASKHALVGLSETLAIELRPLGISVHTICPGGVDTRLAAEAMPDRDRSEWMTPADIAHAAVYLAGLSPRATTDTIVVRRFDSVPIGG